MGISLVKPMKVRGPRRRRVSQLPIFQQPRAEKSPVVRRSEAKEKENAQQIIMNSTLRAFD